MTDAPLDQEKSKKRKGFRKVPNAIDDMNLTPRQIVIWGYLESHAKSFNPTLDKIALKYNCSTRTIIRELDVLAKSKMITIKKTKGKLNHYETMTDSDKWVVTPVSLVTKKSSDTHVSTVVTPMSVPSDTHVSTSSDTHVTHIRTSKRTNIKEQLKEQPSEAKKDSVSAKPKPSKFKFEDWQLSLAQDWVSFHQEHFPGTEPKPEQWANHIRIICGKRPQLNQESFPSLLNSIKGDSFWSDKATSLPSLNKPSKSNPDVLKLDQVLKGVKRNNKHVDSGIDDIFADELKARRDKELNTIDVDFNTINF